ncbi:dienelactone hydrolase family protein [Halalkalibacter urbisdiaboli]|uniref:dienelactone hydrolase family protein n=1 Tax=Halalkalibacter urbisdiaboli TaxID=1960589 RepID=UPI000B42F579|nr:dienelactone hydrolase family protein [Halalkalibacter urbisdiaboli]
MFSLKQESDKAIIVVHEIYGINQHMKQICQAMSEYNVDVFCPNLLTRNISFDYTEEKIAYRNFTENIGFHYASNKIKTTISLLKDDYKKVYMVGFSVGATVAWLCSQEECLDGIVGYYGSRIRDYSNIHPSCPTMLFFPQTESSFIVDEFIPTIKDKNVKIHKFNGKHGFSDPYSPYYHEKSAQQAFHEMVNFFQR